MVFSVSNAQFDDLAERGWTVVDDSLDGGVWRRWSRWLSAATDRLRPAAIGRAATHQTQNEIRGDLIHWLEPGDPDPTVGEMSLALDNFRYELGRELRLGLRRVEAHVAVYPEGRGYHVHVDQHRGQGHRKITFILYLNENWTVGDGGELELHSRMDGPKAEPRIIEPLGGRLVLFQSDLFPHGVRIAHRSRKSLTGWFRDDDAF